MEGRRDTILNPILIAEVLSDSTTEYDRTAKFAAYRSNNTFKEYLLISPQRIYIEHFYREGECWIFNVYEQDSAIALQSLQVEIYTTDIYQRIEF